MSLKLFYLTTEIEPFASTSHLGKFSVDVPLALQTVEHDIRTIIPNKKLWSSKMNAVPHEKKIDKLQWGDSLYINTQDPNLIGKTFYWNIG